MVMAPKTAHDMAFPAHARIVLQIAQFLDDARNGNSSAVHPNPCALIAPYSRL